MYNWEVWLLLGGKQNETMREMQTIRSERRKRSNCKRTMTETDNEDEIIATATTRGNDDAGDDVNDEK